MFSTTTTKISRTPFLPLRRASIELAGVIHDGGDQYYAVMRFASGGSLAICCTLAQLDCFVLFQKHVMDTNGIVVWHPCLGEASPAAIAAVWRFAVDQAFKRGEVA